MGSGKLIVVDGIDGSGKTVQTHRLVERLRQSGYPTWYIEFPRYETPTGAVVKRYLEGGFGHPDAVGPYRGSIPYALDRYAASRELRRELEAGKIVVANRYVSANMGHQTGKIADLAERERFLAWLEELEFGIFGIPRPDLVLLLWVTPKIGQHLSALKPEGDARPVKDMHESSMDHLTNAANAYRWVAERYGWPVIDCAPTGEMLSIETVHDLVWATVQPTLPPRE